MSREKRPRRLIDRHGGVHIHGVEAGVHVTVERLEELRRSGCEVVARKVETGRCVTGDVPRPGLDG